MMFDGSNVRTGVIDASLRIVSLNCPCSQTKLPRHDDSNSCKLSDVGRPVSNTPLQVNRLMGPTTFWAVPPVPPTVILATSFSVNVVDVVTVMMWSPFRSGDAPVWPVMRILSPVAKPCATPVVTRSVLALDDVIARTGPTG